MRSNEHKHWNDCHCKKITRSRFQKISFCLLTFLGRSRGVFRDFCKIGNTNCICCGPRDFQRYLGISLGSWGWFQLVSDLKKR